MHVNTATYSRDLYLPWVNQIMDEGEEVHVRGTTNIELLNCASVVLEPEHHCILIPSRRWNPWLAMSEALWILAGRDDVKALEPYNSHIKDYSDDGVTLYGAYGPRIYPQIDDVINRLKKDPSDRAAVLQIWDDNGQVINCEEYGYKDLVYSGLDRPCNNMVYFKLRQGKLHMTVINRSNDLHMGLFAVNLPTFGILQSYIAARIGVRRGTQTHFSNSLHIYTSDKRSTDITDRMIKDNSPLPEYPKHEPVFTDLTWVESHQQFAEMCSDVLDNKSLVKAQKVPFLGFASFFLSSYTEKQPFMWDGYTEYEDWKLASWLWAQEVWKTV